MTDDLAMPAETQTGLRFQNVHIARGGEPLIALDAHVAPGAVLTVMGPSGVGKSRLLAYVDGTDVTRLAAHERHMGLLFQDALLFPHLSVGGNLAFALPPGLRGRAARRAAIAEALGEVGLAGLEDRDPATLSGGQKARVALMRVLVSAPRALLLDEPFSKLDTALRDQIRELVFAMARARGLPVLLVTHDAADAAAAGGAIIEVAPA